MGEGAGTASSTADVLRVLSQAEGGPASATGWIIRDQWCQDTTGALCAHAVSPADGRSVFVKIDATAPAGWSKRLHERYLLLDRAHEDGRHITPRPVAWTINPPAICYEWMAGQRLKHAWAELATKGRTDDLKHLSHSVGAGLRDLHALWQRAQPRSGGRPPVPMRLVVVGWCCGARASRWRRHVVHSPRDLGPWNIIAASDHIGFIDLDEGVLRPLEAELGSLVHRVEVMALKEPRMAAGHSRRERARLAVLLAREVAYGYGDCIDAACPVSVDLALVHAAAAVDAATVGAYRLRAVRRPSHAFAAFRKLRGAFVHIGHAWSARFGSPNVRWSAPL